jgi:hypothetical protein
MAGIGKAIGVRSHSVGSVDGFALGGQNIDLPQLREN